MSSKIKLTNENGKVLELSSGSITTDKQLDLNDFKYIRDTIGDMLELNGKLEDGDVVFLKGYHTIKDGGRGTFVYSSVGPKEEHNGGTIIDPSKVFPENWDNDNERSNWFTANNNDEKGILLRLYTRAIDQKWFGSKEDGKTNDELAINKASDINVKISINKNQTLLIKQLLDEIKKIDGVDSGIDSDLLDGQQRSYYQNADHINAGILDNNRLSGTVVINNKDFTIYGDRKWDS